MAFTARELWNRLRDRLHRDRLDAELREELRFHQAMLERDHHPRTQLGNTTYIREETRAMWSFGWIEDLLQDLRYAARALRHNVAFTSAVVLTLALGIGANTAIFSVVNAVVLRQLPYADPDRLVSVWTVPVQSNTDRNPASFPDVADWRAQNTVFTDIGAYVFNRFEITSETGADVARAIAATPSVYPVLGATPLLGRLPLPGEDRTPVVAISYRLWQRRFGGDPTVIGRKTTLDDEPYTIVGVMPAGFHFPSPDIDLWMTMSRMYGAGAPAKNPWLTSRGLRGWRVVARLKPGVTAQTAQAQMNEIMHRLGSAYPNEDGGSDIAIQSIRDDTVRGVQRALWLLLGTAGLVLLLGCANVAHLMLARMSARSREIAIRRALGAHRGRVARQLLTESVFLGALGGIAGLAVAAVAMRVLVRLSPADIPRLENVSLDGMTLLFALGTSLLTGVIFGVGPTIVAWHRGGETVLREQARGSTAAGGARLRSLLTAAEVAFALIILVGAGLMLRSFTSLLGADLGFQSGGVSAFHLVFSGKRYPAAADRDAVMARVFERVRAIPGVTLVGASTSLPPARMQQASGFMIDGDPRPKPGQEPTAIYVPMTSQFLPAIGVPLLAGRRFTDGDGGAAPRVALISREMARRSFAGRDPLGHRLRVEDTLWTIVGVVGDIGFEGVGKAARPVIFVPWAQSSFGGMWVAVKSAVEPASLFEPIRAALHDVDPSFTPRDLASMNDVVSATMVRPRFQTWLLGTFGALALLLAAVGIYGVIAYGVAQRTAEIGLRIALGAPPHAVVGLVLRRGMTPVVVGLAVGIAGALALSRVMSGLLYGVSTTDATTFVATTVLLAAVALAAAYAPSARAARLDPLQSLRNG